MKTDLLDIINRGKKITDMYTGARSAPLPPHFRCSTVYSPCTSDAIQVDVGCVVTSLPVATAGDVECDWLAVK